MPPVRDEEHEIQRKAHAKRVRETRRSTQGDDDDDVDEILDEEHKVEMMMLKKILIEDSVDNEESRGNTQWEDGDVDDNDRWEVEHKVANGNHWIWRKKKTFKSTHLARRDS